MVAVSYPGVYVEEVQSAVHTITGVATSITAFIGRALRGPTDKPQLITSFAQFEREYGGLWTQSSMSYAVHQFYQNGGTLAVIVRIFSPDGSSDTLDVAKLVAATGAEKWTFQATKAGAGGNALAITVRHSPGDPEEFALFALTIFEGVIEKETITVDFRTLRPGQVLGADALISVEGTPLPSVRPNEVTKLELAKGADSRFAKGTKDEVEFTAATIGTGGSRLEATVADPSTAAGEYNLIVKLLDAEGDVLASTLFEDVVPGNPWPEPTRENTTDNLINTLAVAPTRPRNGTFAFAPGADLEKAFALVGITVPGADLPLEAANAGKWGGYLQVAFDHDTSGGLAQQPTESEPQYPLFNLTVREVRKDGRLDQVGAPLEEVARETFRNVSLDQEHSRFIQRVLAEESRLVSLPKDSSGWTRPAATPPGTWLSFAGGDDGGTGTASDYCGSAASKTGIYGLEMVDLFNLLVIPPPTLGADDNTDALVWSEALTYCKRRRAMLLVDAPSSWKSATTAAADAASSTWVLAGLQGADATNAAIYWPRIKVPDPLREYRMGEFTPSGAVAGVIARTDAERGVWKAPAGVQAALSGVSGLGVSVTDLENGLLNPLGINVLRSFPLRGSVVWGARTLDGADRRASQWKYLPVRRLALFIEESLYRGTQWAVFEPNDEPLWGQLRLNLGTFMFDLFRQGAFQGRSPREAYLVKCDRETTTQSDIDRGIVNVIVGFAPLKPAEFIVLKIAQLAGQ